MASTVAGICVEGHGLAWRGLARLGEEWQAPRRGKAGQGMARSGVAWQGKARQIKGI